MPESLRTAVAVVTAVLFIMPCAAAAGSQSVVQPQRPYEDTGQIAFSDPFAYCAAVGTIDSPDTRYTGPRMPGAVLHSLVRQGVLSASVPPEIQGEAVWRCMNGRVWACHPGANLPCLEKADTTRTPAPGMREFCDENPAADFIPAVVTGRATVYEWACRDGKAEAGKQLFQVDERGFLADFWHKVDPEK